MVEMTCDLAPDQAKSPPIHIKTTTEQNSYKFDSPEHFFEGAEKLLEIWFSDKEKGASLRLIPKHELDRLMDIAGCKILQVLRTEQIDSYLLRQELKIIFLFKN